MTPGTGNEQAWKVSAEHPPALRWWDGECLVFNPLSGRTHRLDVVAAEVLRRVLQGPLRQADLRPALAAFLEVEEDARVAALVDRAVAQLDGQGVIHPVGR